MFKKIASIFTRMDRQHSKLNLEKDEIDKKNQLIFDEYFHRLPGFPQGIPVIPVELLFQKNDELIKQIVLARGMSGAHNKAEVETKIMSPIRHLAEMTHLLPASEKKHFKLPGGLFSFCLEVSLFSIRYAERRILTRATPEIRKEEESLWAHAAFLTGLFSEAITAISKLSVYAEDAGIEWHPGMESLYEWLQRNNLKHYHIRWSEKEDRSMIYALAGKAINTEQAGILVRGEKAILKTLLAALNDQTDHSNPLAKINETVRYKIMERDEWSYADRYGKPLAGMHLEPWLIDAMRHLVQKKRWNPNEDNGRLWHGQDGVFLVWPLAASDMQYQLKASECPFIPSTQEILADIMLDAGIIEKNRLGGYLFDIGVPVFESDEKKHVEALKLARYEILFVKTQHKPITGNLQIEVEEDDDSVDDESNKKIGDEKSQSTLDANRLDMEIVSSGQNKATWTQLTESNSEEAEDDQNSDSGASTTTETITQSPESNAEAVDITILFGRPAVPVVEDKEIQNPSREEDPELEALFSGETVSSATNQYDDNYAADYHRAGEIGYQKFPSSDKGITNDVLADRALEEENKVQAAETIDEDETSIEKKPEKSKPVAVEVDQEKKAITADDNRSSESQIKPEKQAKKQPAEINDNDQNNGDLLGALIGSSKTKPKTREIKTQEAAKENTPEIEGLFGKVQKTSNGDQAWRAVMILNRLKKLPAEYLEARPSGITKVLGIGLKETKLELKDCISVLKAEGLLVLIDGYETGLDSTGKPKSRYFLVKADLLNGA
jgi:hypothetical protein